MEDNGPTVDIKELEPVLVHMLGGAGKSEASHARSDPPCRLTPPTDQFCYQTKAGTINTMMLGWN